MQKKLLTNSAFVIKNSAESEHRGDVSQYNKGHT